MTHLDLFVFKKTPQKNRKVIEVKIIDDEEYEKNKAFAIELGEPLLLEIGQKHGECFPKVENPLRPLNTVRPAEAHAN